MNANLKTGLVWLSVLFASTGCAAEQSLKTEHRSSERSAFERSAFAEPVDQSKYTLEYFTQPELPSEEQVRAVARTALADSLWRDDLFSSQSGQHARSQLLKYANGDDIAIESAIVMLTAANMQEDRHALAWTGLITQSGFGSLEQDVEKGTAMIARAAEKGDPFALFMVGFYHEKGRYGYAKDRAQALEYYRASTQKGGHWAENHLGDAYLNGNAAMGIEADLDTAIEYYGQAREAGSLAALISLGNIYRAGTYRDMALVKQYGQTLCETGTVYGAYGCLLMALEHVYLARENKFSNKEHLKRFVALAKKAMKQGNGLTEAAAALGVIVGERNEKLGIQNSKIREWAIKGCPEKDTTPNTLTHIVSVNCFSLARTYHDRKRKEKDMLGVSSYDAIEYYRRANREGNTKALTFIGLMFLKGKDGVRKDYKLGMGLLRYAKKNYSDARAMLLIGQQFELGEAEERNINKAIEWFRKSANHGDNLGMEVYARATYLYYAKPNYEQCYVWGSMAKIRFYNDLQALDHCKGHLSSEKMLELDKKVQQLNSVVPMYN